MEVKFSNEADAVVVHLIGRLDTPASQEVALQLEPVKELAGGTIVLDCSRMTYISSSGLTILLSLRKESIARGGNVIVKDIDDTIRSVFMMTGFLNLFEIR
jgi:anti-anti-sigma factor